MIWDDDVDQIVRTYTLSDIQNSLRAVNFFLTCGPELIVENYWLDRRATLQLAFDIAQHYFDNDMPLEQVPVSCRFDYRLDTAEQNIQELDTSLQEHLKSHWDKKTKVKKNVYRF